MGVKSKPKVISQDRKTRSNRNLEQFKNQIENLRHFIKHRVSEKHPSSFDALQNPTKEVWVKEISLDY